MKPAFISPAPGVYGSEEKDLCVRLLDQHWDIHLLPGVHIWHDKAMVARDLAAQHRSGVCNDLVFALRRCPAPLVFGVLPVKLLNHVRFSIYHKLGRPCLGGCGLFLRHALKVCKGRAPVRAATFREFIRRSRGA